MPSDGQLRRLNALDQTRYNIELLVKLMNETGPLLVELGLLDADDVSWRESSTKWSQISQALDVMKDKDVEKFLGEGPVQ